MKLTIDFDIPESGWKILPQDKLVSLGSCFSDEIGYLLKKDGFDCFINPFGILFHPLSIAKLISKALNEEHETEIAQQYDVFFSWEASGTFFAYDEESLKIKFSKTLKQLAAALKNADVLMVTFGTAFGYRLAESGELVANCHKQPGSLFRKELTTLEEMVFVWEDVLGQLKKFNPGLKIVFTVSPVKHIRDGVIENVRSKSRLIELAAVLGENYFPSFEIIQEELRDYRFYKTDLVHPNEEAISIVYSRFMTTFFSEEAIKFQREVRSYRRMSEHRLTYTKSSQVELFQQQKQQLFEVLKKKYPFLVID